MLAAMATAVGEKGYGSVAVADVIARAGVSRRAFYEHFDNKEECFLAAYDAGVESMLAAIDDAIGRAAADGPLAIARAGTERYLSTLAANPAFARTFLVEVLAAGPRALERRAASTRGSPSSSPPCTAPRAAVTAPNRRRTCSARASARSTSS
jgi:AcrR family transcriptional regulator